MWVCALLVLFVGVLEVKGEKDCNEKRRKAQCDFHIKENRSSPKIAGDFDQLCPHVIPYFQCVIEYTNECGEESVPGGARMYRDSFPFLKDACDKGSNTHANVVKHLHCLEKHTEKQNEACLETTEHALKNYIREQEISDDKALRAHSSCYRITSRVACFIDDVEEKCEDGAKPFMFDVLQRTKYFHPACEKENAEKTLQLLESLELNPSMKQTIKKLIEL